MLATFFSLCLAWREKNKNHPKYPPPPLNQGQKILLLIYYFLYMYICIQTTARVEANRKDGVTVSSQVLQWVENSRSEVVVCGILIIMRIKIKMLQNWDEHYDFIFLSFRADLCTLLAYTYVRVYVYLRGPSEISSAIQHKCGNYLK